MRGPLTAAALLAFALAPAARAEGDRITASPTLPKTNTERQGASTSPVTRELSAGQTVYSREGQASAQVAEVVRDKQGKPMRVILTTPDQIRRYTSMDDIRPGRGRIEMRLSREQIQALPRVETE